MRVKCGMNDEDLEEDEILVCHHCGTPVCKAHGWVATSDEAFADPDPAPPSRSGRNTMPPEPVADPVPPFAMHCRKCAEKFHRMASRRHGRIESRLRTFGAAVPAGES